MDNGTVLKQYAFRRTIVSVPRKLRAMMPAMTEIILI
jgi:hypothetical protein